MEIADHRTSRRRRCPSCGGAYHELPRGQASRFQRLLFGQSILSGSVEVTRYACLACGHVDSFVAPEELPKLRRKLGASD